jgi:hypothetical protein
MQPSQERRTEQAGIMDSGRIQRRVTEAERVAVGCALEVFKDEFGGATGDLEVRSRAKEIVGVE